MTDTQATQRPQTLTYPIVGAFYRPPARAILEFLRLGTELLLIPEPTNKFDQNAIAVWIETTNLPKQSDNFDSALAGFGTSLEQLKLATRIHLGYIPKEVAARLKLTKPFKAKFYVGSQGGSQVRIDIP